MYIHLHARLLYQPYQPSTFRSQDALRFSITTYHKHLHTLTALTFSSRRQSHIGGHASEPWDQLLTPALFIHRLWRLFQGGQCQACLSSPPARPICSSTSSTGHPMFPCCLNHTPCFAKPFSNRTNEILLSPIHWAITTTTLQLSAQVVTNSCDIQEFGAFPAGLNSVTGYGCSVRHRTTLMCASVRAITLGLGSLCLFP